MSKAADGTALKSQPSCIRVDLSGDSPGPHQLDVFGCQEKGGKQYQEDSFCTFCSPEREVVAAAIFDGHGGLNGRIASTKCAEEAQLFFKENWKKCISWDNAEWQKQATDLFHHLNCRIRDELARPPIAVGNQVQIIGGKFKGHDGTVEKWIKSHNQWGIKLSTGKKIRASKEMLQVDDQDGTLNVDDKGIVRKASGFPVHGGTTGTVTIVINNPMTGNKPTNAWRVVTINAGDSDCLLCPSDSEKLPQNEKWKHLSTDHGPDSASEYMRIKTLPDDEYPLKLLFVYDKAAVYRKYECPLVFREDGTKDPVYVKNPWGNNLRPTNVRYEPGVYAVTPEGVHQDITCIAMTRSLGDLYAHQFGLTWRPAVSIEELPKDKTFIIAAGSDGIWDCWKFEEFSDYCNQTHTRMNRDLKGANESVLDFTVKRAKQSFGVRAYDDASLCLLRLQPSSTWK